MLMSIFSSFDVLCGESYGQKSRLSPVPSKEGSPKPKKMEKKEEQSMKKRNENEGNSSPQNRQKQRPRTKRSSGFEDCVVP
ncbi:Solute carrier family 40 member like [Quillaja saponaria]|uniref:Solute carrier family 40 member like n=1 Tax=Quillaja saponaria TaxID=32244 RepID=A0AAD7PKV9_QUISA|nr:Solute carrier family 40 member like [Quillaja saponaria]